MRLPRLVLVVPFAALLVHCQCETGPCAGKADGTACEAAAGAELCLGGECAACSGPADDATCSAAYGGGSICSPGGQCVSSACANLTETCNGGGYICCGEPVAGVCRPGNCCTNAECTTLGEYCASRHCTTCPTPTGNTYYVDPQNGGDTGTTGAAECPFKTLDHALAVIGSPSVDVTLRLAAGSVLQAPLPDGGGGLETFPIDLPEHIFLEGVPSPDGGRPIIYVPANAIGVVLSAPSSGLRQLVLDGMNDAGVNSSGGIAVFPGTAETTRVEHVVVQNMNGDGITVGIGNGGVLTLGPGVVSRHNGDPTNRKSGLVVLGTPTGGRVIVDVGAGQEQTAFNANTASGVVVIQQGTVSMHGVPGTNGDGTLVANYNEQSGIGMIQATTGARPLSTLDGVVAFGNLDHGLAIGGGSVVQVRRGYFLGNVQNGVLITNFLSNNDVTQIDLGTDAVADAGMNVVQSGAGQNPNAGAGICLGIAANTGAQLNARGNVFAGPRDCSQAGAGAVGVQRALLGACSNRIDVGIGGATPNNNTVLVDDCTLP